MFTVYAQDVPGPQSMADLDQENAKTAELIIRRLSTMENGTRILVGNFGFDGYDTSLSVYWRENLISSLSNQPDRNFTVTDGNSQADYTVSGEIINAAGVVRIYVRLIKTGDASITTSWHTDLGLTEFVLDLLDTGSSTGRRVSRDAYEPDGRENPLVAEAGETWINRTLHDENDEDWFLFTAAATGMACFETSGDIDTIMELYEAEGSQLDEDDDGGDGANARIDYPLEEGKQYLAMVRAYSSETGAYRFRVQLMEIGDAAMEPNDTREQAFAVDLNTEISGYFQSPSDEDWYRVEIPAEGSQLTAYTNGRIDTLITVYDGDGKEIAGDDDSGDGYNAKVSVLVSGGSFYIRVRSYEEERGDYTFQVQLREPAGLDSYEPDNSLQNAKPINAGETQRRSFSENDNDWVSFTVSQRGYYVFRARGENSNDLDTYLELYAENENIIDEDDDGGEEYSSRLRVQLDPGTYYINIYCLADGAGE
ncbi:MAG: PPC domain-containing protein, partial [Treponema sp.]|nr:PPC domain-containing protein [Treponema sp.]